MNFQRRNYSIFKNFYTTSPNTMKPSLCTPLLLLKSPAKRPRTWSEVSQSGGSHRYKTKQTNYSASWISVLIFWVLFWSTAEGWTIRGWELRFRTNRVAPHYDRHLALFPRVILPWSTTCAWHRHASPRLNCQASFIQRHYAVHFPSIAGSNSIYQQALLLLLTSSQSIPVLYFVGGNFLCFVLR
jgi:hypothetical protein